MENKSLKVSFTVLFVVFVLGYIYSYANMLGLYLSNVVLGVMSSVLYPILLGVIFYLMFRWIGRSYSDESVSPYTSVRSYVRIWLLSYEWVLFIIAILLLIGLFPRRWIQPLIWMGIALLSHFIYPKYLTRVFRTGIAETEWSKQLQTRFQYVAYGVSGVGVVFGFGGLLLSIVAKIFS